VGFSKVPVRPKIFVSIFSDFYVLLIFYFCVINDVQNPHVSVLKIIFLLIFICCYKTRFVHLTLAEKSARLKLGWGMKFYMEKGSYLLGVVPPT
jgi:hypothetical protein